MRHAWESKWVWMVRLVHLDELAAHREKFKIIKIYL